MSRRPKEMSGEEPGEIPAEMQLCRHAYQDGAKLSLRYTLSDGRFVGEIDIAARGGIAAMQMLAYDLLQVTSAWAEGEAAPETNAEPVMKGRA